MAGRKADSGVPRWMLKEARKRGIAPTKKARAKRRLTWYRLLGIALVAMALRVHDELRMVRVLGAICAWVALETVAWLLRRHGWVPLGRVLAWLLAFGCLVLGVARVFVPRTERYSPTTDWVGTIAQAVVLFGLGVLFWAAGSGRLRLGRPQTESSPEDGHEREC